MPFAPDLGHRLRPRPHLVGRGRALVVTRWEPRSVDIVKSEPCRIPLHALLGWHGNVTPRVVPIAEDGGPGAPALAGVELTGDGRALLDVQA